ncbi:molybdate ABC transporter substrate-binding protein [Oceanospirillum beijerinckii]|uniref:molybdate ABC transporter substrate-binding protein n=1 Tax=Oceanospirillum beijerinckii TaxID=64976 RepID=UPI00040B2091|nr:molybdate ABC transporter substrate-binding protein [Oceanospirillum beijerinckii]
MPKISLLSLSLILLSPALPPIVQIAQADNVRIAVASNFTPTLKQIAQRFEQKTGHQISLISGSTGKHYAQIRNGAPFDAFFAADSQSPKRLEQEGNTLANSRFTYAIGRVVLWSPKARFFDDSSDILRQDHFHYLAIANPKLAPYGQAAQQVMEAKGVWQSLQGKLVRGENIAQAYQYVKTGNAQLGFIALSQLQQLKQKSGYSEYSGSYWLPDQSLYSPIEQQAVLLNDKPAAQQFFRFVKSPEIKQLIQSQGYTTP